MGIYLFNTQALIDILKEDDRPDFGKDIIPNMLKTRKVCAYPFRRENQIRDVVIEIDPKYGRKEVFLEKAEDSSYWRDVGTLDAYWNSNMDLTGERPYFNLYGRLWPIRTYQMQYPPSKTALAIDANNRPRSGEALDSLVSHGCVIVGGVVRNSVLSYNVYVQEGAVVEESVILENAVIGKGARVKKAIIGDGVFIPPGMEIGYRPREDMKVFTVTPRGITVVTRDDLKAM
jgi:glucose-1-phosphate adenylyltransferase